MTAASSHHPSLAARRLSAIPAPPPHQAPPSWLEATGVAARDAPLGPWPGLRAVLRADLLANDTALAPDAPAPAWLRSLGRNLPTMRLLAVVGVRLAQAAGRRSALLGSLVKQLNHAIFGCDIAWQAQIDGGLVLFHPTGVVVGPACRIGPRCSLMQGVTVGSTPAGSPAIGANVFLGPGACVLGAVTVGDDVIVGANAVVTGDVEPRCVVGGVPARVLRHRAS